MTSPRVLGPRVLGRAALDRQLLLRRAELPVVPAVERLLGLNAQSPNLPYLALWNRLRGFTVAELTRAVEDRTLVRSTLMRATQHLLSVPDFRLVRPALTGLLRRVQRNAFGTRTAGLDLDALVAQTRRLLADGRVLTRPALGRQLALAWPEYDPTALGWTAQYLEPVLHPAPSGTWNTYGATPFASSDWTGVTREATAEGLRELVRRYLAAFGPATVADARAWSGVAGLREVFAGLRPELRVYADESGRELFDLPDRPLPPADLPAPVRLLPEFDAPLLAYADRSRIMTDQERRQVCVGAAVAATVLVDGTVAAMWSTSRTDGAAVLTVRPLRRLTPVEYTEIEAEADRLLAFTDPDAASRQVRLLPGPAGPRTPRS
ncbi:winged helix DNA-binding domain-containing protein [Micromonospora sp. WMMD1102]|uniref:winged helix DNA-binding domain-containing protein n=1 Tax=Micromonospora sp. WMMD1102 TaxID=3016105 RepID=UPI0024152365|nr:winged helix DNA-binding domain-containing protein [Micromonospora sp. WMMD1102]MDG4789666.1 winged helix DNA-binding domain-containing protein [Micromonospora sp. WMMD1102]